MFANCVTSTSREEESNDLNVGLCDKFYFQNPYVRKASSKVTRCHFAFSNASFNSIKKNDQDIVFTQVIERSIVSVLFKDHVCNECLL